MADVIPSWTVFIAAGISLIGATTYIRKVLRGEAHPNRVTWIMWAVAPLTAFIIEIQEGVGVASTMTFMVGAIPVAVLIASWKSKSAVWNLGPFDFACGVLSIIGLIVWLVSNQPTLGLLAQVTADSIAALPTIRKSFFHPQTEAQGPYLTGTINATITLLTLKHWTTAGVAFPLAIFAADILIWFFIVTKVGQRFAKSPLEAA